MTPHRQIFSMAGFTLIEIIIVIAISGIIAVILGTIIRLPADSFEAQVKRAELVDMAESSLRRMQRDIHAALPNSIRIRTPTTVGTGGNVSCPADNAVCAIEMLQTSDGGRYRAGLPGNRLLFDGADTQFGVIGSLQTAPTSAGWLVINNQTSTGTTFNAYNCPTAAGGTSHNCVRPTNASTTTSVTMGAAFFPTTPPLASESQHFFIVSTPVTYLCDTSSGNRTLTRYQGYPITANHASVDTNGEIMALAGASSARSAELVVGCRFTYLSGPGARGGLVTIELTIQDPNVNEQVRLMHQVHVYNSP